MAAVKTGVENLRIKSAFFVLLYTPLISVRVNLFGHKYTVAQQVEVYRC
jgi:hypothetical protein